ncbi:MAG: hypothetical protein AB1657_04120 [Candidatus Micrarchaeota archaeon]
MRETGRQIVHMLIGLAFLLILQLYGRHTLEVLLFGAILAGFFAMHIVLSGFRVPFVSWFVESFEREGVRVPGFGSAWYAVGALLAAVSIQETAMLSAVIAILAFGDSLSTIFGRKGKWRIPYNRNKTLEGSIAFFAGSLSAYYFIGPAAVPLALFCAAVESIPLPFDDNIAIPAAAILFLTASGAAA